MELSNATYLTPALAEMLRWIEEQAPVGEWVVPQESWGCARTKRITKLEHLGFIETRRNIYTNRQKSRDVRVIRPIASPGVEIITSRYRTPEMREKLRESALRIWKPTRRKGLIRYAGYESGDAAW